MKIKWKSDKIRVIKCSKINEVHYDNKKLALSRNNSYIISNIFDLFKFKPTVKFKTIEKYLSYAYGFCTYHYYCSDYCCDIDMLHVDNHIPTIKSERLKRKIYTLREMADSDIYTAW